MTIWVVVTMLLAAGGDKECGTKPADLLDCAQDAFQYGRYEAVVGLLRPVVEKGSLKVKADRIEALRIYGVSLFLTRRRAAARLVFERLVLLDSSLHLDPRLVPPEVVRAYKKVRAKVIAERLASVRSEPKPLWVWNLFPPGGQIQNKQYLKASLVGSAEILFLGLNLASYFILTSDRYRGDGSYVVQDQEGRIIEDHRTLARTMQVMNYVSFGLLIGTIVYGIVDGWVVMHGRLVELRKKRSLLLKDVQAFRQGGAPLFGLSF